MLKTRRFGSGPPLVALHGFTHTGEQFRTLAEEIGHEIRAPDLPGHGGSVGEATQIDVVLTSIGDVLEAAGAGVPLLGYSQGARLALLLATRTAALTGPLVLVSGTAGIPIPADRRERAEWDRSTGDKIIEMGIEPFIDEWTADGITSTAHLQERLRLADKEQRLANTAEGLASALSGYGTGTMPSVWHLLTTITVPTLVISGSDDVRYTEIGGRLVDAIGENASHAIIEGSGHDPFLTIEGTTAVRIKAFLGS